ncbi:sigma factor-like helix-turn-helix DNA-binding protein [Streptomyces sp. NPDC006655]|uniref:sigma factor-like helix-turn-helix DNA-binding protein n=1 Tax=Streptomyces sp. NPDC006655 TaxID=3156898 RepID=UPI003451297F
MRNNRTGGQDAESWDTASKDRPDLPEPVQYDVDRVAEVVAAGFRGPVWHQMADEMYAYSFGRLCAVMRRTEKLMKLTEKSPTPLSLTDEDRGTLYRSAPDREHLAILTLNVAMETFPQRLKTGGYDPVRNPGKNGKHAHLTSYFYGRCGLVFPRVFYTWRTERTDRFLLHAPRMGDGILAHALGQTGPEPVPDDVAALCDALTAMINGLRPRDRAVWLLTVDKLSQGEIADLLGIKIGDVQNARTRLKQQVKMRRSRGELYVPPSIEAEWARRRAEDKTKKKAA